MPPKSTAWSETEDVHLAKAYVNASSNAAIGTDQSFHTLWKRVFENFELLRKKQELPYRRDKPSKLQCRWASTLKPDCTLFINLMNMIRAENHSGWEYDDIISEALLRFTSRREAVNNKAMVAYDEALTKWNDGEITIEPKKPRKVTEDFKFMHVYDVLKNSAVFLREASGSSANMKRSRKRQRREADGNDASSSVPFFSPPRSPAVSGSSPLLSGTGDGDLDNYEEHGDNIEDFDEINPNDSMSIIDGDGGRTSITKRPIGKKQSKKLNSEQHTDRSLANSQKSLADSAMKRTELFEKQLHIMEKESMLREEEVEVATICASTIGLTEVGKQLLEMRQQALLLKQQLKLQKLQQQLAAVESENNVIADANVNRENGAAVVDPKDAA